MEEFLLDCRACRLTPKTLRAYGAGLRYFRDWLAANSLIGYLRVLKTLSRWLAAEEQGYLRVRRGKGGKTRAVSLPGEVALALARYLRHYRPPIADPHFSWRASASR